METHVRSAVETDSVHNAEEVLITAKMRMTGKIALSALLKQTSVFITHTYIFMFMLLLSERQKWRSLGIFYENEATRVELGGVLLQKSNSQAVWQI